jgi:hypothetical protein
LFLAEPFLLTDERTQYDELSELAVMSALGKWLRRWQPIAIHSAMLAGARPEAVAGALGNSLQVAFDRWHEWAINQRDLIVGGKPGLRPRSTTRSPGASLRWE